MVRYLFRIIDIRRRDEESHQQIGHDELAVPLFRISGCEPVGEPCQRRVDHAAHFRLEFLSALQRKETQRVDHLALLVHHVVVFQQPLAGLEVLQLDPFLRVTNRPRDQRVGDDLPFFRPGFFHPPCDAI